MPSQNDDVALRNHMRAQYHEASETVLEHLDALEAFLVVCICSGYSLGVTKSLDRLVQPSLEALGEVCGHEGSEACERHLKVIKG